MPGIAAPDDIGTWDGAPRRGYGGGVPPVGPGSYPGPPPGLGLGLEARLIPIPIPIPIPRPGSPVPVIQE